MNFDITNAFFMYGFLYMLNTFEVAIFPAKGATELLTLTKSNSMLTVVNNVKVKDQKVIETSPGTDSMFAEPVLNK